MQRVFNRIGDFFAQHTAFRQTYNDLSKLSDRELADIGLYRGNLGHVAMEAADMAVKHRVKGREAKMTGTTQVMTQAERLAA